MTQNLFIRKTALRLTNLRTAQTLNIDNLGIKFTIKKGETSTSNSSTIEVMNLSAKNRKFVEIAPETKGQDTLKGLFVELTAGYEAIQKIIFVGDATAKNMFDPPNWITKLTCEDGGTELRTRNFQRSYASGFPIQTVILDIVRSFNVDVGFIKPVITTDVVKHSMALSDTNKNLLDKFAEQYKFKWSIQNNAIQILDKDIPLPGTAIVIGPKNGLIKSPVKTDKGIEFETLLIPTLVPSALVQLIGNDQFPGFLRINDAEYVGNNITGEYKAKIIAETV